MPFGKARVIDAYQSDRNTRGWQEAETFGDCMNGNGDARDA